MSFMPSIPPTDGTVRNARQPLIIRAKLIHRDGKEQDIVIRNLSECGMGACARGPAPVRGEHITIILPGGQEVKGLVRWFSGHTFGMQLETMLDFEELSLGLQRQAHIAKTSSEWRVESRHRVYTPQADPSRIRRV